MSMNMKEKLQRSRFTQMLGIVALVAIAASVGAVVSATAGSSSARSEHWGVIARNTIGSPVAALRTGPFGSFGVADEPPFGQGSLGIEVADAATAGAPPSEKVDFGNEVDFFGDQVLELNPALAPVLNRWSEFIDATATGDWYFTGSAGVTTGCNQATTCTFEQAKMRLDDGAPTPIFFSVAVGKGRDNLWAGAVDGLRMNTSVFDFEPNQVRERGVTSGDR